MRKVLRDNGLTIVLVLLFAAFLFGQFLTGFRVYNADQIVHGQPEISLARYATTGHFIEVTFENWESEFLQMGIYVVLTAMLFQRGSAESLDPDNPNESSHAEVTDDSPWPVKRGGFILKLYENSLAIALLLLFAAAFVLHAWGGVRAYNEDQASHGEPTVRMWEFMKTSEFWFQSFQNWQSEMLAVASLVVLSIFLRQRNSAQSKPVEAPHSETGT